MNQTPPEQPVLYSFRRCPYAMRARMAIAKAGITVELREVVLRDKPQALIEASAKATVPVLLLPDGSVIDESYDILLWAFGLSDPDNWLPDIHAELAEMVVRNDGEFKKNLDGYKYSQWHNEKSRDEYRDAGAKWLAVLDDCMRASEFLCGNSPYSIIVMACSMIADTKYHETFWFS